MLINKILYINLDSNIKRKKLVDNELNRFNLNYKRVRGVRYIRNRHSNIKTGHITGKINDIKYSFNGLMKSFTRVGCMLAHLRALMCAKKEIDNGATNIMIIEDDISFKLINDFESVFDNIIKNAPANWSILKIHCSVESKIRELYNKFKSGEIYTPMTADKIFNYCSAGCYIINSQGVKQIYDKYYSNNEKIWKIKHDYILADIVMFTIPNVYSYNFPVCLNNITDSDIYQGKKNNFEKKANKIITKINSTDKIPNNKNNEDK